jgi:hypothetical protein
VPQTDAELRLIRNGAVFKLYDRPYGSNADWTLRDSFTRTDLPSTLQVGLFAFSYSFDSRNHFLAQVMGFDVFFFFTFCCA